MFDSVLLITLGVIFLSALISIWVRRRVVDRCLRDFRGDHVSVELENGRCIWGRFDVFPRSLELIFPDPVFGERGLGKRSFILFREEMPKIQAIYRYHDELDAEAQDARRRELADTADPTLGRRARRAVRNFFATFQDAFNQSLGAMLERAKVTTGAVVFNENKRLSAVGDTLLDVVGNAYEPILERHLGHRVVVEETRRDLRVEHFGMLREYSSEWLLALDCRTQQAFAFDLESPSQLRLNQKLDFVVSGEGERLVVRVTNLAPTTARILRATAEGYERTLDLVLPAGEALTLELADLPPAILEGVDRAKLAEGVSLEHRSDPRHLPRLPPLKLWIETEREVDIILPRSRAVMRHAAELRPI